MAIPPIKPYEMPSQAQLLANEAQWRCDPSRSVLLIHDMQQYFLDFFPRDEPPVTDLVANIVLLRRAMRAHGVPVIYTAQPGGMTLQERGLLLDIWGPGMSTSSEEREIVPDLAPEPSDVVLVKWRYSAFARSNLSLLLHELQRDQLIICGVYAHVGCLMTACDAFSADIQPFLVADAIADFTLEYHLMALRYASERCAVTLLSTQLLDDLNAASGR